MTIYSFLAKNELIKFLKLPKNLDAALGMAKFKTNETDIDTAISRWLDHAADRIKKLKTRVRPQN